MFKFTQSHYFRLLQREAGEEGQRLVAACLAAGLMQGLAVFSVLQGLEQLFAGGIRLHTFLAFLVCIGIFYRLFRYMTERAALLALQGVMSWRMRIATKLRAISPIAYERLDSGKLESVLLDEREMIVEATRMFMASAASSVMILVAFSKMLTVSITGTTCVIILLSLGLFTFLRLVHGVYAFMDASRDAEGGFASSLKDLQGGLRQLKVHTPKTAALFADQVIPGLKNSLVAREATEKRHGMAISFFAVFNLLLLGTILFLFPGLLGLDSQSTSTMLVLTMFCLTPMMSLVSFVPLLTKVERNLLDLTELENELDDSAESFEAEGVASQWQTPAPSTPAFASLVMRDVRFEYVDRDGLRVFGVQVDHFELAGGELVFIRGGNGSGKSTFMNMLAGLYPVQSGLIELNGMPVAEVGMEAYRNIFSILPTDFHLFRRPLGLHVSSRHMQRVLEKMRIDTKVRLDDDGSFSTLHLSAGQRKRLALACALLEDRDVFLFDEVAADFDPVFRRYFYEELLPELRQDGKTVLAISHDDRYFSVADRVLTMREGLFVNDASGEAL